MPKKRTKKSTKSKKRTKRITKRATKKRTTKKRRAPVQYIIVKEQRRGLGRHAAENAAGGAGMGFGFAAGHELGDWAFGD